MGRSTKKEAELRASHAADLLAKGHSSTAVTTQVAEIYGLSRRQARRITSAGIDLIVEDFEQIDLQRPQMVATLVVNLQEAIQKGLIHNQISGVAAAAKQIISLCGLSADSPYNSRSRRTFQ